MRRFLRSTRRINYWLGVLTDPIQIGYSAADHVLMFTATPINRGAEDLLSLVDQLGADNFEDWRPLLFWIASTGDDLIGYSLTPRRSFCAQRSSGSLSVGRRPR